MFFKSARIMVRISYILLLFCAILVTLSILFLSRLNLNDYRQSLEQQLSSALNQPVTIGHGSLTYSHGLALELEQVQIGAEDLSLIKIPRLLATLEVAPLLEKKFILDQVRIEAPQINITYPLPASRPRKGTSHQLFNSLGISSLTVNNATITIVRPLAKSRSKRLKLDNLHAVLRGWQENQSGSLVVSAKLPEHQADILLETKLSASIDPAIWRQEVQDLNLQVRRFSTQAFPKLKGQSYPQALDLNISVHGAPIDGTQLKTRLTDAKTDEELFSATGTWISKADQDSITLINGNLLGIPLTGNFHSLRQAEKNHLSGSFGAQEIKLNSQLLKKWRIPQAEQFVQGDLEEFLFTFEKSWSAGSELSGMPHIDTEITLTNLDWNIPALQRLQDLSVEMTLNEDSVSFQDGILVLSGEPIEFSGKINSLFQHPQIDIKMLFNPQLKIISDAISELENFELAGHSPGKLELTGALFNPDFKLRADLGSVQANHPWIIQKTADNGSAVTLSGSLSRTRIELSQATLQLGKNTISGSGYYDHTEEKPQFKISLSPLQLEALQQYSPLVQRLQFTGAVSLTLEQINHNLQGEIQLDSVSAHLTSVIADLRQVSGTARVDRHGLNFSQVQASLGESEFKVNGQLTNWASPLLGLDIQADRVRAQDIIFPNRERMFYDLDGHLRISAEGIYFTPVNVRLEDETLAQVNGSVTDFSDPQVNLEIQAESVNVLEVIDLFNGSRSNRGNDKPHDLKPVRIKVAAVKGTLGGLHFKNASGLITDHNNLFTLFPLRFENDDGWCQARVEFHHQELSAPLKISGHLENFNISVLHQDLFKRPGLINGTVTGDFYVQGKPQDTFWQQAQGGIHVTVRDGVLRKFKGLAKVFSLLNVSQIFSGKLPDMDTEGMPFSLLQGSAGIAQGKVNTEDLAITSEAMNLSLVGSQNLINDQIDFTLEVMPLRTVDKVITKIPLAGWILTGENKAFLTAYFKLEGNAEKPQVSAIPLDSVSKTVFGIFKRTLGLPGKLVKDVGSLFDQEPEKKADP